MSLNNKSTRIQIQNIPFNRLSDGAQVNDIHLLIPDTKLKRINPLIDLNLFVSYY